MKGDAIVRAGKAAAQNRVIRSVAASAAAAAAARAGPILTDRYDKWSTRRRDRDRAIKLARQIRGRVSADTIIGGEPHFVVWKDGRAVEAFPAVPDLAARPELRDFDPALAHEPPPLR